MRQRRVRVLEQRDGDEPGVDDEVRHEIEIKEGAEADFFPQKEQAGGDGRERGVADGDL